jgi:hypothetical protein
MTKIYQKLSNAREQFHTLQLKKSGHNKFAGYYYFELGDFLIPALDVFKKCGLFAFISFGADEATMTIVDLEDGGEVKITSPMSTAALKGCHEVQNLGAVQTYLRRYLWVAALEIVEHDAVDASQGADNKPALKEVKKMGALSGIGDDLPEESKEALKDLAAEVTEICESGNPAQALATIRAFGPQGDESLYLDRQLPSHVRTALRKANQPKAA